MRLFIAVVPPQAAVDELAAAVRPLRRLPDAEPLRWTSPGTWHLTLAFLGEVAEESVPELEQRLGRAAHRHRVMRLRFAGAGRFGDRTLWTGVRGDTLELRRLAESAQAAARHTGLPVDDDRPYRAHLTLARGGGDRRRGRGSDLRGLKAALEDFEGQQWEAADLRLVRSTLGAGPAQHTLLRSWPLDRPADGPPQAPE
ncbi:RNA 2',3'-cyclic phosphodiesterase [Peterkaempfera griseoplana]|uniref:RNA 2',3'-cyclic phosphodiesterase n=1 Tax=Peterkaempfera griseoplana TaxID=66896 RepID=UPI0006E1F4C3|nr:RNA 2',3'-cyclic phosphodiesterase [Peterkaempfera griseoplana]